MRYGTNDGLDGLDASVADRWGRGLATSLVIAPFLVGCARPSETPSASPPSSWGPLAVVNEPANGDFARTEGTVRLEGDCAMLELNTGDLVLLVWSADQTTWLAERQTVRYRNVSGGGLEVADGDSVSIGGSGMTFVGPEAMWTWHEWIDRRDWMATPHDLCRADPEWTSATSPSRASRTDRNDREHETNGGR